jgi:hypothetical protein
MTSQNYVTRRDGSIDYGYYKQRGRNMRSEAVRELTAGIGRVLGSLVVRLAVRRPHTGTTTGRPPCPRDKRTPTPLDTRPFMSGFGCR